MIFGVGGIAWEDLRDCCLAHRRNPHRLKPVPLGLAFRVRQWPL